MRRIQKFFLWTASIIFSFFFFFSFSRLLLGMMASLWSMPLEHNETYVQNFPPFRFCCQSFGVGTCYVMIMLLFFVGLFMQHICWLKLIPLNALLINLQHSLQTAMKWSFFRELVPKCNRHRFRRQLVFFAPAFSKRLQYSAWTNRPQQLVCCWDLFCTQCRKDWQRLHTCPCSFGQTQTKWNELCSPGDAAVALFGF